MPLRVGAMTRGGRDIDPVTVGIAGLVRAR
jgi:hypothetical protein